MQELHKTGAFLESAEFGSNMYGTSKDAVKNVCSVDKICILDIELQGVMQVCGTRYTSCGAVYLIPRGIPSFCIILV